MEEREIIIKAIDKWGWQIQTVVCMEECSELIKECSKMLRGKGNRDHLAEEIADVYICLEMLQLMNGLPYFEDIEPEFDRKIERLKKRIEETPDDAS